MNTVFMLLFLLSLLGIFIFVGHALINLIKKNPVKKTLKKAGISTVICIASLVGFGFTMEILNPESIELSIPDYQNEYDINTEIPFEVSVSPENADKISFEYISDNDALTFSNSGIWTGTETGTYEIHIESGNVISNTLSITVVDMTARKAEQEAEEKRIAAEESSKAAEAKKLAEEESSKAAEEKRLAEEESSKAAEEKRLAEKESSKAAEEKHIAEEKASKEAVERASKEAEEKRLAEEQASREAAERAAKEAAEKQLAQEQAERTVVQAQSDIAQNNPPAPDPVNTPQAPAATPNPSGSGDGSNFNTYDNAAQQQTNDTYVLNTSSMKIHYPSCRSVPKIAPQNYSTSSSSIDELIAQGYSTCGNCFK